MSGRLIASLDVNARPAVQGNHAISAHGRIYERSSAALRDWRDLVGWCARHHMGARPPVDDAVMVSLGFRLQAPRRTVRELPTTRPDIDKLSRACLDAMTGIVYLDDAQVVHLEATKLYGETPGCRIIVAAFTTPLALVSDASQAEVSA